MMTLREMDEAQIRILHAWQMHRDFPPSELKSLASILALRERGVYDVLAAYEDSAFVAYALIYRPKEGRTMLLDYLAVEPEVRGRGYGRQFIETLREHYAELADCLLVECERPKAAPDEKEARRRIQFYQQAGAQLTSVRIWLFDVEYSILVLPCREAFSPVGGDWAGKMLALYRQMLPPNVYERSVRLIRG